MLNETLLIIPFSVIGKYSLMLTSHWLQKNLSLAASGVVYRITDGFLYVFSVTKLPL
jgi:hypothetical protein